LAVKRKRLEKMDMLAENIVFSSQLFKQKMDTDFDICRMANRFDSAEICAYTGR